MAVSVRSATSRCGLGEVELRLGARAAPQQLLDAIEIDFRLVALRLLGLNARIERLHLQHELLVGDDGDFGAGGRLIAFLGLQRGDGAADARARDELMDGLDSAR